MATSIDLASEEHSAHENTRPPIRQSAGGGSSILGSHDGQTAAQPLARTEHNEFSQALGSAWNNDKVQKLAQKCDRGPQRRLLERDPVRNVALADDFVARHGNISLSGSHLYGALIYTRGDIVHEVPCQICSDESKCVFPQCISAGGLAAGACAAHIWIHKGMDCNYHTQKLKETHEEELSDDDDSIVVSRPKRAKQQDSTATTTSATPNSTRSTSPTASARPTGQNWFGGNFIAPVALMRGRMTEHITDQSGDEQQHRDPSTSSIEPVSRGLSSNIGTGFLPDHGLTAGMGNNSALALPTNASNGSNTEHQTGGNSTRPSFQAKGKQSLPTGRKTVTLNINSSGPSRYSLPLERNAGYGSNDQQKRQRNDSPTEDERPAQRPRYKPALRDTLDYLHGDFDYGSAELVLEVSTEDIEEARMFNRIQVGPYLLCRFKVEMNTMWALRVAAARHVRRELEAQDELN